MHRSLRPVLAALAFLISLSAAAEVIDIDSAELARLSAAGVPVVDVRTGAEWQDTGVLPGSRLLTFFDEQGRSDPAVFLRKLQAIAQPNQPVIVLCRSGNRSRTVAQLLSERAGYAKVYNVKDGVRGWTKEGRALSPLPTAAACAPPRAC